MFVKLPVSGTVDDILVSGRTFEEHLANLRMVFERLHIAKLKLSPGKCDLFQLRVGYLGHILSESGISTDPGKIEAVSMWPPPSNLSELTNFLGLCSYYRRFIASFAAKAKPLHKLLEVGQAFEWTPETQQTFQELKEHLVKALILGYPLPDAPFILDTDASNRAIGAVLSQVQDGQERVIAYYRQTQATHRSNIASLDGSCWLLSKLSNIFITVSMVAIFL